MAEFKLPEGIERAKYGLLCKMEDPTAERWQGITLAKYMIKCVPEQHPLWDTYCMTLISLKEQEGLPPAQKEYPEAEYELCLYVMDPELYPTPGQGGTWRLLTPANISMQFDGISEEEAITICYLGARAIIFGMLPAEPEGMLGAKEAWIQSLRQTLEHIKHGHHQEKHRRESRPGITPTA